MLTRSPQRMLMKRCGLLALGALFTVHIPLSAEKVFKNPAARPVHAPETEKRNAAYKRVPLLKYDALIDVSGKVTDKNGQALPGVNVVLRNTQKGTTTNANGEFSLSAESASDVLVFSFIGYKTQQYTVGTQTTIAIILEEDTNVLDEVVVTALGITREKKSLGYATQQVTGEIINESPATNFVNNLSGKVAGVNISSAGGVGSSSRITIRGESSLSIMSNQPLFVIDGVPIGNDGTNNSGSADYGNSASEINPADIESINVLKGPAAAALYGSRAARGAIVITTKKGSNRKGLGVSFNSYLFVEQVGRLPKFQNDFGQGNNGNYEGSNFGASWSGYPNGDNDDYDESWGPRMNIGTTKAQFDSPTTNGFRGGDVAIRNRGDIIKTPWISQPDNIKDFFTQGSKYYNNLAFSGGNENGDYRLSLTSLNEKGVIPNNNLNRYQVNLNSSYHLTKRLTSSININYVKQSSTNRPDNGYGRNTFMYFFTWMGRNVNINSLRNYWQPGLEGVRQFQYNYGENHNNPFFLQYEDTKGQNKDRVYGNIALEYAFNDHLKLKLRSAADLYNDFRPMRWAVSTVDVESGSFSTTSIKNEERNTDFLLTYTNAFGGGDFGYTLSAGGNRFDNSGHSETTTAPQLLIPGIYTIQNTASPLTGSSGSYKKRINSLYGVANFNYKDLFYLDINARNDWSSTLPKSNNSYFYPSVGANANIKSILSLPKAFSQAQLRGSWAQVGNDTGPYSIYNTYGNASPWNNYYALVGPGSLLNPNLKPEITSTYEFGAALGFLNNRLGLDVTYYDIRSKNQIISLPLVQSSGATSKQINAGQIRNTGVEVMINATPVSTASFKWNFNVNWSHNTGKVVSLTSEVDKIVQAAPGEDASVQARVGEKMGAIWGPGYQRVADGAMKGQVIIFNDAYPRPTSEDIHLGNYNPDWIAGIYNQLTYKNVSLNFAFGGQFGGEFISRFFNKAAGAGQLEESALGRSARTPGSEYKDPYYIPGAAQMEDGSYQPNNTSTDGTYSQGVYGTNARYFIKKPLDHISEAQIFSSTYFKLRELSLGYSLPSSWVTGKYIKNARIAVTGRNLFLFTPKSNRHFDPEVATATSGGGLIPGFENMSTPSTREMGVSLNLNF
ncbi:SusC/RagA family TonB-linked outer membrane protein [Dyadobacter sandarakinus]|uniref:SusC/RagA family TonB-linked outer membrane protein n=1 Tax=Dyadobacter sandarakinus TaxID=2747268 RepID=A0ABX7I9C0_9BACT|nr:SusC/RagA family TonB-linked outer membrane protein [Dyadobacter sandarakinus]QRR02052.1 SusC/RagA family TonB-linked outer membrane protein [Dyadobacter sandarakinus]